MFLSRGNIVEIVNANVKTLRNVLKEYISKGLTGRISYRNAGKGVYISIESIDGKMVACRGVAMGTLYEGVKCCDIVVEYLDVSEGVIEVAELMANAISQDIEFFPFSKIDIDTKLHQQLLQEHIEGIERSVEKVVEGYEISIEPTAQQIKNIQISDECIDPMYLYNILKHSQLAFQSNTSMLYKDVERIVNELKDRNPRYIYISTYIKDLSLRILLDIANNIQFYELEKENRSICGEEAYKYYLRETLSNIRIWINI
uniref:Uncharacterized protein n=1 Tax=Ignisphaera aggregans TaxID=334771 RepID=A0A7J3QEL7_9CREN